MTLVLSIHTLATIIWLGGLFFICVVFALATRNMEQATLLSLWHRVLSRFFVWAWIGIGLILISGIAMVFLEFGGFSGIPAIHRANMLIGIPAILLYIYLYFFPWRRFRQALAINESHAAEVRIREARVIMSIIVTLGVIASVVSLAGRFVSTG